MDNMLTWKRVVVVVTLALCNTVLAWKGTSLTPEQLAGLNGPGLLYLGLKWTGK